VDTEFIQSCLQSGNYLVTKHARGVMAERDITTEQIEKSVEFGEIIEREPYDQPYPSVLVLGWLESGDPLHIKFSRSPHAPNLRMVTVYEPDEEEWESDYKTRKKRR
jgi:hypothetical protein